MPKRSKKKVKQFDELYDVGTKVNPKRIDGRLHVRVREAKDLTAGDHRFLRKGTSDPFCIVVLQDDSGFYSRRRTLTIEKNRDPKWSQQFTFSLREGTEKVSLVFDVWDEDCDEKTDDFLGTATKKLDLTGLEQANMWLEHRLPLKEDAKKGNIKGNNASVGLGNITVLVYYEPWSQASWWMALRTVMGSPRAISTLTSIWCAVIAAICLVAGEGRWLCEGNDLRTCQEVEVRGMKNAIHRAAIYTFILACVQFFGAMGAWGSDWNSSPPHMNDLLEDPEDEDAENMIEKERQKQRKQSIEEPSADMHFVFAKAGSSIIDYKVFIGLNNIKRWSAKNIKLTLRYVAFMMHLLAIVMIALVACWAYLQKGEGVRFGEGFYFGMVSILNLVITYRMFRRTRYVLSVDSVWQKSSGWRKTVAAELEENGTMLGTMHRKMERLGTDMHERVVEPIKDKAKQAKKKIRAVSEEDDVDGNEDATSSYFGMSGVLDAYDLEGGASAVQRSRTPELQKKQGFFCGACK